MDHDHCQVALLKLCKPRVADGDTCIHSLHWRAAKIVFFKGLLPASVNVNPFHEPQQLLQRDCNDFPLDIISLVIPFLKLVEQFPAIYPLFSPASFFSARSLLQLLDRQP